jgi:NADH-quinone oxidoreductase subunit G
MARIFVDGIQYEVADGQNLLNALLSLGLNLEFFCWHPAMGSVGACRQCAVIQYKDENDTKGKLVMACLTPANDGTRISINSVDAKTFRAHVIEWLMVNHPHDCPVCDEGGECHLQDMTVMTGHTYRRFRFKKRTHRNQYLGPFVNHEMNRCIACYRCVRFYRDYAAGTDFDVFGAHDFVYFGRDRDGILENEFSGNLVEVCPTGVFTDKTFKRHYTRKWDLQTAPSICNHCGIGCNTIPGSRYGSLRRIRNRYNYEVNGYFLCDRGRFGYEFVESDRRIRHPLFRGDRIGPAETIGREKALGKIAEIISKSKNVIGIGSPRATLESNFALKTLVGADNFFTGMTAAENRLTRQIHDILRNGPARSASLKDIAEADAVLILGEDLTNTAPMMALAVIQAVRNQPMQKAFKLKIPKWDDTSVREVIQNDKGPLYIATVTSTKLDNQSRGTAHAAPDDIAVLGYAIAHFIDPTTPEVPDLSADIISFASAIAADLKNAERPLIVSGSSLFNEAIIQAAANIAWALCREGKPAQLSYVVPECNTLGMMFIEGDDLERAFETAKSDGIDTAVILENDLYRRANKAAINNFLKACKNVIVLDYLKTATSDMADIFLSSSTYAEGDGTLINNEGRIQRFYQALPPVPDLQESWRWIADILHNFRREDEAAWKNLDDITDAMFNDVPAFGGKIQIAPDANFRINNLKIARKPHRYSGRTAEYADVTVHEPPPPMDHDSALNFTMEGHHGVLPGSLNPRYWAPGWNSPQATIKYQTIVGEELIGGDPGMRLIEASVKAEITYFNQIPGIFKSRPDEYLLVPLYHIFGSEELSSLAKGISELAPEPYVALGPSATARAGVSAGEKFKLTMGDNYYELPLVIREDIPDGVAGLPFGLRGLSGFIFPAWGKMEKIS